MNIYKKKIRWKFFLFLCAISIGIGSLWYTNKLVKKLATEERKKIELWAKATSLIPKPNIQGESLSFLIQVLENNETVPVILVDKDTNILEYRNLDSVKVSHPGYLEKKLEKMMEENPPIEIPYMRNRKNYLYYSRSTILTNLTYYPVVQLGVILLFILVAYFAFSSSRKAEQNQVWVGLSKETAHQLGTPISSLMACLEILKESSSDQVLVEELEKDINRLNKITERFSKIGSQPALTRYDIVDIIRSTVKYLRTRSSDKVEFLLESEQDSYEAPVNPSLFEWVVENVCKNAMDAIDGNGKINIVVSDTPLHLQIDITDNGKGIPKSQYKTVFKPGFTTKERGWGLGLSLTKRIVEEYHKGKIFVSGSEIGKGTTIRILLKK
jgi:nitrogen-specific signal transduction histidine kinase